MKKEQKTKAIEIDPTAIDNIKSEILHLSWHDAYRILIYTIVGFIGTLLISILSSYVKCYFSDTCGTFISIFKPALESAIASITIVLPTAGTVKLFTNYNK